MTRNQRNLSQCIRREPEFDTLFEDIMTGKYRAISEIPSHVWGYHGWDQLHPNEFFELMLPYIQEQVSRAQLYQGVYKGRLDIDPNDIKTYDDFCRVPILVKDSRKPGEGFRHSVIETPGLMIPADLKDRGMPYAVYLTGGTKVQGKPTPTAITQRDREREAYGFARGFRYEGMRPGDTMMSTYNPTHKGGEIIKEASLLAGMNFIPRRSDQDPRRVIETMQKYGSNVLLTVQAPLDRGDKEGKGTDMNLLKLYESGTDVIESLDVLFLGGYRLIPEAQELSQSINVPLVTLLGSAEAIPQATNTAYGPDDRLCTGNNLHVLNGPHFMEVVARTRDGRLVPAQKGQLGLLLYTTVARDGTIYVRYAPGDQARVIAEYGECSCGIKSPIIGDISRIDDPEDVLATGCAAG